MCGIAGLIARHSIDEALLQRMHAVMRHRGPDDSGVWCDHEARIGLAHRRLAIVDLSPAGHQPMSSADGRWVLCYNGEIYNHAALRGALGGGIAWRGHSDSETLVEAVARWGVVPALQRSVGMFAIALWDRRERILHLARDRFGEKPLYYGWVGRDFAFASELKALRVHQGFDNPVSVAALERLAARAYVPAPLSIHERIFKLPPGHVLSIDAGEFPSARSAPPSVEEPADGLRLHPFWRYDEVVAAGLTDPFTSEDEALEALDAALGEAIGSQAIADVPVGAFLSGGIDSSTVVALYRKYTTGEVRTFSIGFAEAGFDEAPFARAVAAHFGTEHHERYVTAAETQRIIPDLPAIYDEPFADSSQIPTHVVSAFAREHVKVALSGDGGDELFGGYNRHIAVPQLWERMRRMPGPLRTGVGAALGAIPPRAWDGLASLVPGWRRPMFGTKVRKALRIAGRSPDFPSLYESFLDDWADESSPVMHAPIGGVLHVGLDGSDAPGSVLGMYWDAISYLPDDVLCKVDRASMAVSLETRAPYLDHRVAAVAARIPIEMKISGGKGKQILRRLLFSQAPAALFDRPKAGFAIPVGEWIKGPLRGWAEELLDPRRLRDDGYFDPAPIRERWRQHLAGERDCTQALWTVLMFGAWLEASHAGTSSAEGSDEERAPIAVPATSGG